MTRVATAAFALSLALGASLAASGVALAEERPTTPAPARPAAGDQVGGGVVHFTWANSTDPLARPLRYELEVVDVVGGKAARPIAHGTGGDGVQGATVGGLPVGSLGWRVRAVTATGVASDYSTPVVFSVVESPEVAIPGSPSTEGGCDAGGPRSGRWLALPIALAALILRRRRAM